MEKLRYFETQEEYEQFLQLRIAAKLRKVEIWFDRKRQPLSAACTVPKSLKPKKLLAA